MASGQFAVGAFNAVALLRLLLKSNRERAESGERADKRIYVGEEQSIKDQRCRRAIEEEVVPLDRGSDEAGQNNLPNRSFTDRGRAGDYLL
jgi:hypothetical protein